MSGQLSIAGMESGVAGGIAETIGPFTTTITSPDGEIITVDLAAGDNVFDVPASTTSIVVNIPANNMVQVLLKRGTTDPGFELALSGSLKFDINPSLMTSLNLHAAAALTEQVVICFL